MEPPIGVTHRSSSSVGSLLLCGSRALSGSGLRAHKPTSGNPFCIELSSTCHPLNLWSSSHRTERKQTWTQNSCSWKLGSCVFLCISQSELACVTFSEVLPSIAIHNTMPNTSSTRCFSSEDLCFSVASVLLKRSKLHAGRGSCNCSHVVVNHCSWCVLFRGAMAETCLSCVLERGETLSVEHYRRNVCFDYRKGLMRFGIGADQTQTESATRRWENAHFVRVLVVRLSNSGPAKRLFCVWQDFPVTNCPCSMQVMAFCVFF